jgi:DNA-binding NarL/FixJ family response regulator
MSALRIVLADDHALVRAGMRALLSELPDIEVVGEAGDGQETLELVRQMAPDLALVDVSMPGLNGLEVAARVRKDYPQTRVVMVSMLVDQEFVRGALAAGACGYLLKNADRTELEDALRAVARGESWVGSPLPGEADATSKASIGRLTPRQREVLQMIAEGYSSKEIASRLNVSLKTVDAHRAELMDRLGIHGVAGLVRYAIRIGLVCPET